MHGIITFSVEDSHFHFSISPLRNSINDINVLNETQLTIRTNICGHSDKEIKRSIISVTDKHCILCVYCAHGYICLFDAPYV